MDLLEKQERSAKLKRLEEARSRKSLLKDLADDPESAPGDARENKRTFERDHDRVCNEVQRLEAQLGLNENR